MHTLARPAHEAARCAGAVGKYWPYHDRLFEGQPAFRRPDLLRYAAEVGLDRDEFTRCLDERRFPPHVGRDHAQDPAPGVNSTPPFPVHHQLGVAATTTAEFLA